TPVTTSMTNSNTPLFDPDGKYLYFLSDRDYNEVLGNVDFEFANPKTTRVYIVTLRKDEPSPFPALSDEAQVKKENPDTLTTPEPSKQPEKKSQSKEQPKETKTPTKESDKDKDKEKPKAFSIDLDGIQDRVVALPMEALNITAFNAGKG